jgi:transcription initiation factor TFIIIB Brf1 subunit/transcription initiation factor TFIIB
MIKYTSEIVEKMIADYNSGITAKEIALELEVPERSVIAKLSSLGVYKRKEYLNKRGEPPVKKEEYIERIAKLLDINIDLLESMEKVTKSALVLLEKRVTELKEK